MSQAIIEMSGLSVGYDRGPVVADIDLAVERGEFVALFGGSGCGKSTLLHIMAGLLSPMTGTFKFNGAPLRSVNTAVGYMTQTDTLLPWRTVEANVALPLRLRGVSREETNDRVGEFLEFLNLTEAADRYPSQLSGGMKRRCLLARSMIYRPEVMLMDEPFAAVDAQLREDLHGEVKRAAKEFGQTIVFVTHDVGEAALLSDRVLVLGGKPSTIVAQLISPFDHDLPLDDRGGAEMSNFRGALRSALDQALRASSEAER